jgi:hypothetical protein
MGLVVAMFEALKENSRGGIGYFAPGGMVGLAGTATATDRERRNELGADEPIIKNIIKEYNINNLINRFYQGIITILQTKEDFTFGKLMKQIERDLYQKDNLLIDLNNHLKDCPEASAFIKHIIQYIKSLNMDVVDDQRALLNFYKSITGIASYQKIKIKYRSDRKIGFHTCVNQLDAPSNESYTNVEYNEDFFRNMFYISIRFILINELTKNNKNTH